jgi:hypothetical protein
LIGDDECVAEEFRILLAMLNHGRHAFAGLDRCGDHKLILRAWTEGLSKTAGVFVDPYTLERDPFVSY